MTTTAAVWCEDTPKYQRGDVVSVFPGTPDRLRAPQIRQSQIWRIVVVNEAPMDYWTGFLADCRAPDGTLLLRRVQYLDLDALEAHARKMTDRFALLPDDRIVTSMLQIDLFTKRRLVPGYPGVIG